MDVDAERTPVNLALGKKVAINKGGTLSGSDAENITAGSTSTMWRSYAPDTPATWMAEVTLDLDKTMVFHQIVLTEYMQRAGRLIVSISDDAAAWYPIYDQQLAPNRRNQP